MADQQNNLEMELKELIIKSCNIQDPVEDLSIDDPLFGPESPLGLDSLDAVEVVVAVKNQYGVHIGGAQEAYNIVRTLKTLADYIRENQ